MLINVIVLFAAFKTKNELLLMQQKLIFFQAFAVLTQLLQVSPGKKCFNISYFARQVGYMFLSGSLVACFTTEFPGKGKKSRTFYASLISVLSGIALVRLHFLTLNYFFVFATILSQTVHKDIIVTVSAIKRGIRSRVGQVDNSVALSARHCSFSARAAGSSYGCYPE